MKKLLYILIFILAVQVQGFCADRYYVSGGSGLYNNTNNWGTASGGSSGSSVPSTSDNVIIDPNSPAILSLDVSPSIVNLTITGTSTIRKWIKSSVAGTVRTITTSGTVTLSYCDWQDITGGTTGGWATGTSIGNCGGNSGISYTTPITLFWIGNGGNWSDPNHFSLSSGGSTAGVVPLCHDDVRFDPNSITSGSQTITANMPRLGKDIDFTGVANSPILSAATSNYVFGNLTLVQNMSIVKTATYNYLHLGNRNNCNFTTNNISNIGYRGIIVDCYGAKVTLIGNLTCITEAYDNFYLYSGEFDFNDYNSNLYNIFLGEKTVARKISLGNGVLTSSAFYSFWSITSPIGLTINTELSTILNNSTNATTKTFAGSDKIYNNLKFTGTSGAMIISGSNTFNQLESDTTVGSNTIQLTASTTQALQKLFLNSTSDNKSTVNSTTATNATLSSTKDQFIRHAVITDVNVTGGGNWYYDANSVTMGDGTGWTSSATRNFSTFDTARNTWNTANQLGGNTTSKYTDGLIPITGGTFQMGGTVGNELPVHSVTLSNFKIGAYEVTNTEYCAFLNSQGNQTEGGTTWINIAADSYCGITGSSPYSVKSGYENRPVVYVSWYGSVAYCNWLSNQKGYTQCYGPINNRGNDPSVWRTLNGYRLPTEAEWEYACRAGSTTTYYWGATIDGNYCWYGSNSEGNHHNVGLKTANSWGLYDMSGNVWEWCSDWYLSNYYSTSPGTNPTGPTSGSARIFRGGSWLDITTYCQSAFRYQNTPVSNYNRLGFRLTRTP
jgi:formylglycine-generating enzyme required for sulfatase activity